MRRANWIWLLLILVLTVGYVGLSAEQQAAFRSLEPDWTFDGKYRETYTGWDVDGAGDINGDGFDDVVITAHRFNGSRPATGRVHVLLGSETGPDRTSIWNRTGDQAWELLGFSASGAGDVNGDGYDDVLMTSMRGYHLYHGAADGLSSAPAWTLTLPFTDIPFGQVAEPAGDVNNDGYDDVVIGKRGRIELFLGSPTGLHATLSWAMETPVDRSNFGAAVTGVGDVNGDGYDDILAGASDFSADFLVEGAAYLYFGGPNGPNESHDWFIKSNRIKLFLGKPVSGAGDLNNDGYADFLVGAFPAHGEESSAGEVWAFYGSPSGPATVADWSIVGQRAGELLGFSVVALGDHNGDGYDDIALGAPFGDSAVHLFLGSGDGLAASADSVLTGAAPRSMFGHALGAAGDVNNDGYDDLLVGEPAHDNAHGRANLFYGGQSVAQGGHQTAAAPLVAPFEPDSHDAGQLTEQWVYREADAGFTDVSEYFNVDLATAETFGPVWLLANNDAKPDLYFGNHLAPPSLYINQGTQPFVDSAEQFGFAIGDNRYVTESDRHGAACTDFNNDGQHDLFITRGGNRFATLGLKFDDFLMKDGNHFYPVQPVTSYAHNTWGRGRRPISADFNNDGHLDLYLANLLTPNVLLQNNGDGSFSDVTPQSGLGDQWDQSSGAWGDYNNDGYPDLVTLPTMTLWENDGDGTFTDVTDYSRLLAYTPANAVAWGDYNNDGWLDVAFAGTERVTVYRNKGNFRFTRLEGIERGVESMAWLDADNDSFLELFIVSEGALYRVENEAGELTDHSRILTGVPTSNLSDIASGDFNRDGWLDLALSAQRQILLRNNGGDNHWISLYLDGTVSNSLGWGATVEVRFPDGTGFMRHHGGNDEGRFTQSCKPLHIGLGSAETVDLRITWPSGQVQTMNNVSADQYITFTEPAN